MQPSPLPSTPRRPLDLRVIVAIPLGQFAPWLAMVLLVSRAGYPGGVCVTPLAWLIALRVGLMCATHSARPLLGRRLLEAALAGGWLGFLQGALFFVIAPRLGAIKASEQTAAVMIGAGMVVMGMLAGASLANFMAYQAERRRRAEQVVYPPDR
jgi:hypothetical protein